MQLAPWLFKMAKLNLLTLFVCWADNLATALLVCGGQYRWRKYSTLGSPVPLAMLMIYQTYDNTASRIVANPWFPFHQLPINPQIKVRLEGSGGYKTNGESMLWRAVQPTTTWAHQQHQDHISNFVWYQCEDSLHDFKSFDGIIDVRSNPNLILIIMVLVVNSSISGYG